MSEEINETYKNEIRAEYQRRVIGERDVLADRLTRLDAFITRPSVFGELPEWDQSLLRAQHGAMTAYLQILELRIARFK